ncbi:MAG TPA: hypothetical protein VGD56_17485 [Gemmatirosa sp.]
MTEGRRAWCSGQSANVVADWYNKISDSLTQMWLLGAPSEDVYNTPDTQFCGGTSSYDGNQSIRAAMGRLPLGRARPFRIRFAGVRSPQSHGHVRVRER